MKTRYTIEPAHSGTNEKEIEKAKRMYRKGVKTGEIMPANEVEIIFTDINHKIRAEYKEYYSYTKLGVADIN